MATHLITAGWATTSPPWPTDGPGNKTLFITGADTGTILSVEMPVAGKRMYSHAD